MAVHLPAPLGKSAASARPLNIVLRSQQEKSGPHDLIQVTFADTVRVGYLRNLTGKAPQVVRDHLRIAVKSSAVAVQREARKTHAWATRTGMAERAVTVEFPNEMEGRVFLNPAIAKHSVFMHEGTRPHAISPKNRQRLRLAKGDGFAFAREVWPPGTKADPFLYAALQAQQEPIQKRFDEATTRALKEAGL